MINLQHIRQFRIRIILIFAVFMLFFSSAMGLLEFNLISGLKISVNSHLTKNILILTNRLATTDAVLFTFFGILLSVLLPVLNPIRASLLTFLTIISLFVLGYISFMTYKTIPIEYFMLMIMMLYVMNILISYFMDIHSKQKILETFGQYVPPQIVNQICQGKETISLEGEARELTVLFCDIQDVTRIADDLNPKQLARLLNEYFTELTEILYQHNATIDKFIGDALMAFWGAPLKQDNHAFKAVLCAQEMEKKIRDLSAIFIQRGLPGPSAGFGLNTGLMAVGNMGSIYRMAYTVIGDAVNVAARIETFTRTYQVPIIVSEATMQSSDQFLFREIDTVVLKGKRDSNRLFQPVCMKQDADHNLQNKLEKHQIALDAYYKHDILTARDIFTGLSTSNPDDKYYGVMLDKIVQMETSDN
jgi:adenylate cyclase